MLSASGNLEDLKLENVTKTQLINQKIKANKERRQKQWADSKKKNYVKRKGLHETKNSSTLLKRKYREAKKAQLERKKEYIRQYRQKKKACAMNETPEQPYTFTSRMEKTRYLSKVRKALPITPTKRAAVLSAYVHHKRISRSPSVQIFHEDKSSTDSTHCDIESGVLNSMKTLLNTVKRRRSDEARTALNIIKSSVSGENIARHGAATDLSKKLGIKPAAIKHGMRIRNQILHSMDSVYEYTKRKTRSDAISKDVSEKVFDFWLRSGNCRPVNNKNDVKRVRLGPNLFSSHPSYILEKTQTEIYQLYKAEYPEVKIGQRAFEKCKPYFIRPASVKDKVTCCCRQHVEARALFRTCLLYQNKIQREHRVSNIDIFETLTEVCNATLCEASANTHYHKLSCLDRQCSQCGTANIVLLPGTFLDDGDLVNWERYEYQNLKLKGDKFVRKLVLVKKQTPPKEMFQYFLDILQSFPAHQFRAGWQSKQLKTLTASLPQGHCVAIHDFSENYKCSERNEIQSSYFQKIEVSLHVSIIHRHSILEIDGSESTEENPRIVTEHFFVISPDQTHDHHFTNTVQRLISEYLLSINCSISTMHEFTDGCSSQYKSRHCLGDLSYSCKELGYEQIIRNFFETSHGRGPHDAAGGFIKRQTDLSVLRGHSCIQNAKDVFTFAEDNLRGTTDNAKCSRRIFRYVDSISRNRNRSFCAVKNNRKIHQARVSSEKVIIHRQLSCYSCENCIKVKYDMCLNSKYIGNTTTTKMTIEARRPETDEAILTESELMIDLVTEGVIVALRAEDERLPYFLMRASSSSYELKQTEKDSWGSSYDAKTRVIKGHYFDTIDGDVLRLRLLPRLPAIVPTNSLIYICSEVELENGLLVLSDSLHRRILKALE